MKSGTCPKCGSTEVYMKNGGLQQGYVIAFGFANTRSVTTDDYICLNCGYLEQYIPNARETLKDIATKWKKSGT